MGIADYDDYKDNDSRCFSFSNIEKKGLYKAIFSRRDVRSHFIKDKKIPNDVLLRILNAAHHAPSVGFSQPWNFILIREMGTRQLVKGSFIREHKKSISVLSDHVAEHGDNNNNNNNNDKDGNNQSLQNYLKLKLEGIMESAINICITYDPTRFGPFVLGRTSIPETGVYSVCCAIQNLWLAARAEGIGVGWVSILSNKDLQNILSIPEHVRPIAYLCLGYVSEFAEKPDLEKAGWLHRIDLDKVTYYEKWNNGKLMD